MLVSALDDSLLTPACDPEAEAAANPQSHLITPRWGGYVGFMAEGGTCWSEAVAVRFMDAVLRGATG